MNFALRYAAEGFAVFPVYEPQWFDMTQGGPGVLLCSCRKDECRGKHPRTPNGVNDATTDANQIKEWWTKWPSASIGAATGKISGFSVVDADGPDGLESVRLLKLSSSVVAMTGNGKQLYYADPEGKLSNSVKKLAKGLDTRGNGGYVVVPPSIHPNGKKYCWESAPLSRRALITLPAMFLTPPSQAGLGASTVRKSDSWISEALKGMKNGNIDNTLVSVCGRLRRDGYSADDALTLLRPHADRAGATAGHLEDKVAHVWKSYEAAPQISQSTKSEAIDAFLEDQKEVKWICKPIIAEKSIGFVAGLPETCKTWLLMDLAIESARPDGNWLEIFPVKHSNVLFIDQERFRGETQRRFGALIAAKGLTPASLTGALSLKCGTTIKLDSEVSYQAFRTELLELKPDLVIVDSFATFHSSPENDRMAIQNVLNRVKQLRDEIGCAFIFINHESKMVFQHMDDNKNPTAFDMLGSVGIVAAAEFCLTVRKIEPGLSMVHHTKSTLATASKSFTVALQDTVDGGITVKGTL